MDLKTAESIIKNEIAKLDAYRYMDGLVGVVTEEYAKVKDLKAMVDKADQLKASLAEENAVLQAAIAAGKIELEKVQEESAKLKAKLADFEKMKAEAEAKINSALISVSEQHKYLSSENERYRVSIEELKNEKREVEENKNRLISEYEATLIKHKDAKAALAKLAQGLL